MRDIIQLSKKFIELTGIEPVEGMFNAKYFPDFVDACNVLRVMDKRPDWDEFQIYINVVGKVKFGHIWSGYINDKTGLMLENAVMFLEKKRG